jgi:hypothetical protein
MLRIIENAQQSSWGTWGHLDHLPIHDAERTMSTLTQMALHSSEICGLRWLSNNSNHLMSEIAVGTSLCYCAFTGDFGG